MAGWNPAEYARFGGHRLQPALDLLARIGDLPDGDVVDLGCGNGAVGPALRRRFPDRRIVGVDSSPAMLSEARAEDCYDLLDQGDIADWRGQAALIFSNAALHWLANHGSLMPRLTRCLVPGGVLAVQVPNQNQQPSHRLWLQLAEELFPGRVDRSHGPRILDPAAYYHLLGGMGRFTMWQTEYFQLLPPCEEGHPVRRFTASTFARPVLEALDADEQARLIAAYESVIGTVYPAGSGGEVLFPFRRLFFTVERVGTEPGATD